MIFSCVSAFAEGESSGESAGGSAAEAEDTSSRTISLTDEEGVEADFEFLDLFPYKGKEYANIFDVVVLPSHDMQGWAKIELRRFREYGRLALNWDDLVQDLGAHLATYGLTEEDIDMYDYDDMEVSIDE